MPKGTPTPRPIYWSPEFVLTEMREGRTFSEIIDQANQDLGRKIPRTMWWAEVHRWRHDIPGFREEWEAAMEACYTARGESLTDPGTNTGRPPEFSPELQLAFLQEMMRNGGNAVQACYDCGVSRGTVFSRLDPKSPNYDEEFTRAFHVAEAERGAGAYEKVWHHGQREDENGKLEHPLLLRFLMESRMAHLFSPRRKVDIEGNIHHSHEILPASVTRQLASTSRALLPAPKAQLEEPALEAEYVEAER